MPTVAPDLRELHAVVRRHWGFDTLRPMQEQAMRAVLERRDSLLVLPTGGGKSLCFQAPAVVLAPETTVVVSPLIALMKDQVDALKVVGVPAASLESTQSAAERQRAERDLAAGNLRLVFVSPERLVLPHFQDQLRRLRVRTVVVDEAHCISHWGHDFRPPYRQLRQLRDVLPGCAIHAFTATATEQVRHDICEQLGLNDPVVHVGRFERLNLTYRVTPRDDPRKQVIDVLERHANQAGIIYCMRKKDVDELTAALRNKGYNAMPYHAGLADADRQATQEAFRAERCDIVVATVAFGMGIDRSNVRFVLHTGMPKSIEHYQQEAGRAGRDGLDAECVLLYSGGDLLTWKSVVEKSAEEAGAAREFTESALRHLNEMSNYARAAMCRHKALVEHFGQPFEVPNCGACDVCLGEVAVEPESQTIARKFLSCVARTDQRFGIGHVVAVLRGEATDRVRQYKHDQLTTFGLLKEYRDNQVRAWAYQLITLGVLEQSDGEYPTLRLNDESWAVLRDQRQVSLTLVNKKKQKASAAAKTAASMEGVDADLFEVLRDLRRQLAARNGVPPYVVFSDATLRELARLRPETLEAMRGVYGIGERKLADYGELFLEAVRTQAVPDLGDG